MGTWGFHGVVLPTILRADVPVHCSSYLVAPRLPASCILLYSNVPLWLKPPFCLQISLFPATGRTSLCQPRPQSVCTTCHAWVLLVPWRFLHSLFFQTSNTNILGRVQLVSLVEFYQLAIHSTIFQNRLSSFWILLWLGEQVHSLNSDMCIIHVDVARESVSLCAS